MPSVTSQKSDFLREPSPTTDGEPTLFISPWLWGPLLTAGFYVAIPFLPEYSELVKRLFCSHPIVYAQTGLFFVGVAILIRKAIALVQEHRSLKVIAIDVASLEGIKSPEDRARSLFSATANVPAGIRHTSLVVRIRATCAYVSRRGHAALVEDHLRYLADLAMERLESSHAAMRTIVWTVPVVGVLATVVAISTAFQGVPVDRADAPISAALAGLGSAFDPTALGLAMSVVLVFGKLLIEPRERQMLARVEQFGIDELAPCFNLDPSAGAGHPLAAAESDAAARLIERTETLINWQTGLWQEALEGVRGRWVETAKTQEVQFAAALQQGMAAGLSSHSQQLQEAREEFLKGFRAVGMELSRVTAGLQQMGEEHQNLFHQEVAQMWQAIETRMASARGEYQEQTARSVALLDSAVRGWHEDLARVTTALTSQIQELLRQRELLHDVAGHEEELVRLQTTLTHNLQSVRAMEAFEESIHSLNAAVHLLTMRTKAHAA